MSTSRVSLSAYRPRPGRGDEVLPHLREEVAALRAHGYITNRPVPICRTTRGEYLVISEWTTETSVDEAHADDAIREVWRRKEQLVEYIAPADLDQSDVPFASYDVVDDA
jgi:heme-degrading monooxygenase HmoA